jgi:hypothetical protein
MDNVQSGLIVSREINAGTIKTGVLLTGNVQGNVETAIDTPRALLLGIASGVAMGMVFFLLRLLFGRKK